MAPRRQLLHQRGRARRPAPGRRRARRRRPGRRPRTRRGCGRAAPAGRTPQAIHSRASAYSTANTPAGRARRSSARRCRLRPSSARQPCLRRLRRPPGRAARAGRARACGSEAARRSGRPRARKTGSVSVELARHARVLRALAGEQEGDRRGGSPPPARRAAARGSRACERRHGVLARRGRPAPRRCSKARRPDLERVGDVGQVGSSGWLSQVAGEAVGRRLQRGRRCAPRAAAAASGPRRRRRARRPAPPPAPRGRWCRRCRTS